MATNKRKHGVVVKEEALHFRFVPPWVLDLARANGGFQLFFIAAKRIERSDLASKQNRLLIPKHYVEAYLLPALSDAERAAANLIDEHDSSGKKRKTYAKKKKKPATAVDGAGEVGEPNEKKKKKAGRENVGLAVTAFARSGLRFRLRLTRWDSNQETVMKGNEVKLLTTFSSWTVGEEIEVWGFRLVDHGDLCFAVGRHA